MALVRGSLLATFPWSWRRRGMARGHGLQIFNTLPGDPVGRSAGVNRRRGARRTPAPVSHGTRCIFIGKRGGRATPPAAGRADAGGEADRCRIRRRRRAHRCRRRRRRTGLPGVAHADDRFRSVHRCPHRIQGARPEGDARTRDAKVEWIRRSAPGLVGRSRRRSEWKMPARALAIRARCRRSPAITDRSAVILVTINDAVARRRPLGEARTICKASCDCAQCLTSYRFHRRARRAGCRRR